MKNVYLASGFAEVDQEREISAYTECLELLGSLPYYRRSKYRTDKLLRLGPGATVLDVGCGLGDDVVRIAGKIAPGGRVTGVDASAQLIQVANSRAAGGTGVEFRQADACRLPFSAAAFSRCRVDRTLQHIIQPEEAIREMVRVLEIGGLLLAYDNDWESLAVSSTDRTTTRAITELWCDSFPNGWIGRYLKMYFRAAGLKRVSTYPGVSIITDFDLADRIYNLRQSARRATAAGIIEEEKGRRWLRELLDQSRRGCFFCALTAYTAVGHK